MNRILLEVIQLTEVIRVTDVLRKYGNLNSNTHRWIMPCEPEDRDPSNGNKSRNTKDC